MTHDWVVVGGGISGLTTATILAQHGKKVALLEEAAQIAPLLRGFDRCGVHFDTGFHYAGGFGGGEILDRYCRYLGVRSDLQPYPLAADGFDRFRPLGGGQEFRFPVGCPALRDALKHAFPAERGAIDRFLETLRNSCQALPYLNLDVPMGELGPFGAAQGPSLGGVLDGLTANRSLKELLSLHWLLYGIAPHAVPLAIHASVAGLYYQSAHGLLGGGASLAAAFARRLESLGVTIHTACTARRLQLSAGGALEGVECADGRLITAGNCVVSLHPSRFLDLLPEGTVRPVYRRRLAALEETVSAFILFAESSAPLSQLERSNLYLGPGDGSDWGTLPVRSLFLAANPPDLCGRPGRGCVAIRPVPAAVTSAWAGSRHGLRPAAYHEFKALAMAQMQDDIEVACPELRGQLRLSAGATPLTLRDYLGHHGHGLYGAGHRVGQFNPQPATRLAGLYLTGQAVTAPGVLGAMLAGFLTCGQILGHELLRKEVRACH